MYTDTSRPEPVLKMAEAAVPVHYGTDDADDLLAKGRALVAAYTPPPGIIAPQPGADQQGRDPCIACGFRQRPRIDHVAAECRGGAVLWLDRWRAPQDR